jgi:hypothetical protein
MYRRLCLRKPILGADTATHLVEVIPAGAIIDVAAEPQEGHMTDVLWEARLMRMSVQDIQERAVEFRAAGEGA